MIYGPFAPVVFSDDRAMNCFNCNQKVGFVMLIKTCNMLELTRREDNFSSTDTQIGIEPLMARLVRVLDGWMTSNSWPDYLDSKIMEDHTVWKTMILCKEEFTKGMVGNVNYRLGELKGFFVRRNYHLAQDTSPIKKMKLKQRLLQYIEFLERSATALLRVEQESHYSRPQAVEVIE